MARRQCYTKKEDGFEETLDALNLSRAASRLNIGPQLHIRRPALPQQACAGETKCDNDHRACEQRRNLAGI